MLQCRFDKASLAVFFAGSLTIAGGVSAEQLRIAVGHPPGAMMVQSAEKFSESLEKYTDGELSGRVFAMSLLNMAETSAGLRDGLADAGALMTTMFPNEFPATNMIQDASLMLQLVSSDFGGREGMAFAGAMTEFVMLHCPECVDEFKKQNQVFIGAAGSTYYQLNCTKPVHDEQTLSGSRLRVSGGNWARWSDHVGARPVTMSGNEMLEALRQGILECIVLSVPDVFNFGMAESVTDITLGIPGGVYGGTAVTFNRDAWLRQSADRREDILRAAGDAYALASFLYFRGANEIAEEASARGISIHEPSEAVMEKTLAFVEQDLERTASRANENGVFSDPSLALAEFRALLEEWADVVADVEDEDALAEVYWERVYSKIDVAAYGE